MNTNRFTQLLDRAFEKTPSEQVQDAQVQKLRQWRPLAPLLDNALEAEAEAEAEDEVEEYSGTFEAWPGNVRELLEQHGLVRSLLTFNWDGFGPVSWSAGLVAIETGGVAYVCKWDELDSYQLLAAVSPAGDTAGLAQVIAGEVVGGSLVQHPPHNVWNNAPRLLDRAGIEDAFAKLLDNSGSWGSLADEHFGRVVEPNHLRRCLDLLEGVPRLDDEDAFSVWLERI